MNIRQEYIISYDISDNKNRTSLYKILLGYGLFPIQKSVFWGLLTSAEKNSVHRNVQEYLKEPDKAFILPIKINKKDRRTHLFGYMDEDFNDWKK